MRRIAIISLLLLAGCGKSERTAASEPAVAARPAATATAIAPPQEPAPSPPPSPPSPATVDDDYRYDRPLIEGVDQALKYRDTLSDGRATPTDIRDFLIAVDRCQHERIPRYAEMLSCTYRLNEDMRRLKRKYRRDKAALAVFDDLFMM